MPNDKPIIIQQSQSQTQNGCCAGTGCGSLFGIAILLALLISAWEGMMGEYGLVWQIALWVIVPVLLLLVLAGGFAYLDERFGWGIVDSTSQSNDEANTKDAADIIVEDELNYGTADDSADEDELTIKLRRLANLRDQGLITSDEFEAKKRELLDNM